MKEYPMLAQVGMASYSYASRRGGSNLLAIINAPAVIRNAHGNWKSADITRATGTHMADVCVEDREMVSAKAKHLVATTVQLAIKRLDRTDFQWGEIPGVVTNADRDRILEDAAALYTDVKVPGRESDHVKFNMEVNSTSGVDFLQAKYISKDGSDCRFKIWDTGG